MYKIPQADLNDFLSNDPKQKSYFVKHIGNAFRKIGFLALKGHFWKNHFKNHYMMK